MAVTAPPALDATIERVDVSAFTVPTDRPESDGTFEWEETTIVVVEVAARGTRAWRSVIPRNGLRSLPMRRTRS